ncbi:hypothetical protein A966_05181 [Brachyspira hampsonii 30446]|uniref:Zinc ribbon domain-containing protein n=2 Tax=Brachyspira hampsonii TaxID=1287055 RepID=A0A2U4FQM9_9SPIR|nr:hypothetical protein A966_05181 [Brachyspira hampsonii 30446]MBW5393472.1 zinc ribbon domain-containing protein [Brachyspira hampsonii]
MLPFNPPFMYRCNSCSKIFTKSKKPILGNTIFSILNKPKCPKCGSKDTKSIDNIIKK